MAKAHQRLLWADIARIVAIYLVITLHSAVLPEKLDLQHFDLRLITHSIPNACIPLFVMLSGALLLGKKETYQTFFKKRLTRILVPWFAWTIVFVSIQGTGFIATLQSFWFLPMINCLYLVTPAMRLFIQHSKSRDTLAIVVLWFLGVSVLPYIHNTPAFPLSVDNGLVRQVIDYFGYFLLGYVFVTIKVPRPKLLSGVLILGGIIWSTIGTIAFSMATNNLLSHEYYRYIAPSTVLLSAGIFLTIYSFTKGKTIKNPYLNKLVISVSTAALAIYFIHPLIQQLFTHFFGKYNVIAFFPPFDAYLNGLIIFTASFGVLWVVFRIPIVRRIFR